MRFEKGQSLIEVIIAVTVGVLVLTALTFATIFSLRNAGFSKSSAQATKLAQEGIERVKTARDRDEQINNLVILVGGVPVYYPACPAVSSWNGDSSGNNSIWNCNLSGSYGSGGNAYFIFSSGSNNNLSYLTTSSSIPGSAESISSFKRVIILSDDASTFATQKTVTVIVAWTDATGPHESKLTTILRNPFLLALPPPPSCPGTGMVGYWKMNEASWTNDCSSKPVIDSTANNNHGKACPVGAGAGPTPVAGKPGFGNAGSFNGLANSGSFIDVTNSSSLNITGNSFSVSAWIKPSVLIGPQGFIVAKWQDPGSWLLLLENTNRISFVLDTNVGGLRTRKVMTSTAPVVNDGSTWSHIAVTYDGSYINMYINSVLDSLITAATSGNIWGSGVDLTIGRNLGAGDRFFKGVIDDVRVYNRSLTSVEIGDLYICSP